MVCILFSRPNHDGQMEYLYHYSKELVVLSESKYYTINKEGKDAIKRNIINIIKKKQPNLIMLNGHGSPTCVCCQDDETLVSCEENPEVLANSITYSFSCSSAASLGKLAVEKGAIAFIGYDVDFALGKDPDSEATPSKDRIAKRFLEPSNLLFSSLIKGVVVQTAIERAKKKMQENVWYLATTKDFPEAPDYAPFLFGNYLGLVIHGNEQAHI